MTIFFNSRSKVALTISAALALMTLTFPTFFFFNPFAYGVSALTIVQMISQIGWYSLIVLPPIILLLVDKFSTALRVWFLLIVLVWPVSLIVIRVITLSSGQGLILNYLAEYPLFFFSDLITPVVYVLMWRKLPKLVKPSERARLAVHVAQ